MALVFEKLSVNMRTTGVWRAKVPGGWFVRFDTAMTSNTFFYPDPSWLWDGNSLPL